MSILLSNTCNQSLYDNGCKCYTQVNAASIKVDLIKV